MILFRNILFCTDFSPTADHALQYAVHMAQVHGAKLILIFTLCTSPYTLFWQSLL